ncbi:MAG TPA: 30S ribosomal protein S6 [Candidatus Paceibacterota bacterium]|nr:30S ribosomal protein S6 [Candidatus Paceibacterota bacterium]
MTNEEKDKKEYELALLLKSEDNVASVLKLVAQHNGEGASEPRAKRLQLAYEIKKHTEAVFVYFTFKAFGDDIKTLEHDLNSHADVLRFMVIASPAPAERTATSAMPPREERRSRTPSYSVAPAATEAPKPAPSRPLSNEALEKKIEEILQ